MSFGFGTGSVAGVVGGGGGTYNGYDPYNLSQYQNGAGINKGGQGFASMTDMLQGRPSQIGGSWTGPGGNRINAGMSGPVGGNGNQQVSDILDEQMGLNAATKAENQATWNEGKGLLYGARDSYNNSPITAQNQALTSQFLSDPEAINNRVQAQIQGKAAAGIDAQAAAAQQQSNAILAAGGQADASSMSASAENINAGAAASKAQTQSGLDVARAVQRNQDFMNAMNQGRSQTAQDYGVQAGTAATFLENMPQYKPDDLSGYAAIAGRQGQGSGLASGAGLSSGTFQAPQGTPAAPQGTVRRMGNAGRFTESGGDTSSFGATPSPIDQTWGGNYGGDAMQYAGGGFGGQY